MSSGISRARAYSFISGSVGTSVNATLLGPVVVSYNVCTVEDLAKFITPEASWWI